MRLAVKVRLVLGHVFSWATTIQYVNDVTSNFGKSSILLLMNIIMFLGRCCLVQGPVIKIHFKNFLVIQGIDN